MADAALMSGPVPVRELPAVARFSLRARPAERMAAATALRVGLEDKVGRIAEAGARRTLCLGPDEWAVHGARDDGPAIGAALATVAGTALVDVSDREVTLSVEGARAAELLAYGCPRDLARMPPGRGARTVFEGVTVVLWRWPDRIDVDVWRSFAPFVRDVLAAANRALP
ncbi:sarcosine oxidase subunit gamma [Acuticoccus sp.]|uniref:sarcosine oxidase subunit gamma n=1 Tax=Acuticoccus sp. TaxID=1904378 RepID=UPI003B5266B6